MKTYMLEDISSHERASLALQHLLPGQESPWLLKAVDGDTIAYFNVGPMDLERPGYRVTADISCRHCHEDSAVISVLWQLQSTVGGASSRSSFLLPK